MTLNNLAGVTKVSITPTNAEVPALQLDNVTGLTQCLQANSSGVVSGTGSACGGTPTFPAWTSFACAPTNLSAITTQICFGETVGKITFFRIEVQGTSNGTNPAFTLPSSANGIQTAASMIIQGGSTVSAWSEIIGNLIATGLYNNTALSNGVVYTFIITGSYENT
jgi:hypothetical protein